MKSSKSNRIPFFGWDGLLILAACIAALFFAVRAARGMSYMHEIESAMRGTNGTQTTQATNAPAPKPVPVPRPETPPPAPSSNQVIGAYIEQIHPGGEYDVWITVKSYSDWPTTGQSKTVQGKLYINGTMIDAMRPDQMSGKSKKQLNNAFGSGEHSIAVRRGEMVRVQVKSYDGRATPVIQWKWPFATTPRAGGGS